MLNWLTSSADPKEQENEVADANSSGQLLGLPDNRIRRTQEEVRQLVLRYQQRIANDPILTERCRHFWPADPLFDALMLALVHDIPRDEDPLKEDDKRTPKSAISAKSWAPQVAGRCVEWLGLVNRDNRHATIKVKLPETGEPWLTYTNRLMVYLFADSKNYVTPEDFHCRFNVRPGQPFQMKCLNPVCIRLSHIAYELYQGQEGESQF